MYFVPHFGHAKVYETSIWTPCFQILAKTLFPGWGMWTPLNVNTISRVHCIFYIMEISRRYEHVLMWTLLPWSNGAVLVSGSEVGMGTRDRFICETGLSITVNQSKTGPPSTRFGFLCMHRVPGGVIKLLAPTSLLASQCLPSATIKQPFQNLSSLVPCPLSLCSEAFWA